MANDIEDIMMLIQRIICISLFLLSSVSAYASDIDMTLPATDVVKVNVQNIKGDIKIFGTDTTNVSVIGSLDDESPGLVFELDGDTINIQVKTPASNRNSYWNDSGNKTNLRISVPKSLAVTFYGVSSDVQLTAIDNDVKVKTVSGSIDAKNLRGKINIETVSGDIQSKSLSGRIALTTVSGDISDADSNGRIHYQAVSGDIDAETSATDIIASVISGDLMIKLNDVEDANLSSVSGGLDAKISLMDDGNLEFSSVSGDIKVSFLRDLNADIKIHSSASGSISNKLNNAKVNYSKYGPSSKLETQVGRGGASVKGTTVSGSVRLKY